MKSYSTRERAIYGTFGFVVLGFFFLSLPTLIGVWLNYGKINNIQEHLVCASKPSDRCATGNACLVSQKQKRCPVSDDDDHHHSHSSGARVGGRHWNRTCSNEWFCTEPIKLADGSCCNEDDFCYLEDSTKTCQSGECVSSNYSLCKGACTVDEDCETHPITLSPNYIGESATVCYWGSCITTATVAYNYPNPKDLLDTNTSDTKSTAGCVSGVCDLIGDVGVDEFPYECTFKWDCSKHNPQVPDPGKKRASALTQRGRRNP